MSKLDNTRHELFCQFSAAGLTSGKAAVRAGFSPHGRHGTELLKLPNIQKRIREIQERREKNLEKKLMDPMERRERLSEFARANLVDFLDENGEPRLDKAIKNHGAVMEYQTDTRYTKDGDRIITKRIKLRDPISAIDLLNKMDRLYSDNAVPSSNNTVVFVIGKGYGEKQAAWPVEVPAMIAPPVQIGECVDDNSDRPQG